MKEKYRAFKEWKKNPRHRALYQLFCWFIFFATLYLLACLGVFAPKYQYRSANETEEENSIINYLKMNNYEYEYNIKYNQFDFTVKGVFFDKKQYFTINNQPYYDNEKLYVVDNINRTLIKIDENSLEIPLNDISHDMIATWLENATITETIEYNDGEKNVTYFFQSDLGYTIEFKTTEKDNFIQNINFNLVDYLNNKGLNCSQFEVNLSLTNINNISSYEKDYDSYQILNDEMIGEEVLENAQN